MKTDTQFFNDRMSMCETAGWADLLEELQNIYEEAQDVDAIRNIEELWFAKGQLAILRMLISTEDIAKITMEQSSTTH
ncbi:MAG: hypothetical protein JRE23_13665 [Deltaproteobacteria bacterium]|jgi:hypothetical protein|nr:hypothetical protein [Deltaproteobacteria bacterium]